MGNALHGRTASASAASSESAASSASAPSSAVESVAGAPRACGTAQRAFAALDATRRAQMLALGPVWARDIVAHRRAVLAAYEPVLARRPDEGVRVVRDLAYGAHARQRLDVYWRPDAAPDAPVVAFVHGGAFVRGEKDATPHIYGNVPRWFARHGCVGVNIEYRLADAAPYPGGAEDVIAALATLQERVARFGGDPGRVVLVGHSAGAAHAAAALADPALSRHAHASGLALISGRLRADLRDDNPNAHGVRAYYGTDAAQLEARSVAAYAAALTLPLFLAVAQFENPYLDAYTAEVAARVAMAQGRLPRFVQLEGQNHTSMVAHFDAGEELLDRQLLEFVREVTRAAP